MRKGSKKNPPPPTNKKEREEGSKPTIVDWINAISL
jgi:hypothetical protein